MNVPNLLQNFLDDVLLKAINDLGEGVILLDLPRVIYSNDAFCTITGYDETELLNLKSFFELIPEDNRRSVEHHFAAAVNKKTPEHTEISIRLKNGELAHLELSLTPVKEGPKTRLVSIVRNVTGEKKMSNALAQSAKFEKLIMALSSQFINLDPAKIDESINNAIRVIGESIGVDRIFIFLTSKEMVSKQVYAWNAKEASLPKGAVTEFKLSDYKEFSERLLNGEVVHYSSPDELPPEASHVGEVMERRAVQSFVIVPMLTAGNVKGFLTFSTVRIKKIWAEEDLFVFKILGEMFASAIERKKNYGALMDSEEKFKGLFNNAIDSIFIYEMSESGVPGNFVEVNDIACSKLGYTREEIMKLTPFTLTSPEDVSEFEKLYKKLNKQQHLVFEKKLLAKNGSKIPMEINSRVAHWGERRVVQSIARDITDRKRSEETIRRQSYYDLLTNLPNRMLFKDRLEQAMKLAHRNKQMLGVLVLDLDRFKNINETLGHVTGDKLLVAVSERLLEALSENETIARFGGDEFTFLLPQVNTTEEATEHAQKIIDLLAAPFKVGEHELHVTTSIGIAFYPEDGESSELLLKNAETAMYRAKEQGRNNFQLYASGMNVSAFKQLLMENSLRRALEKEEFVVFYQPQIDLATRKLIGAEALVRWQHPDLGLVFPNEFIGLAEETGLIVPIGEWIIQKVCKQSKAWYAEGLPKICVSVNLSARQFQQVNLVSTISRILLETGLDPQHLGLEITESIAMKNADFTISALNEFKRMKIHLSLDDFGTGYSSLSYLKRFPLETLKIDRSFVRDITTDPNDAAIVNAVVALAHSLKLNVIAEGVESEGQLAFLKNHKCDGVQGYIFSHPLAEDQFVKFMREHKA